MKTGIMTSITKSKTVQRFSVVLALVIFFELGIPTVSWALTSGPGQPEYSSFEPASTTDMVNLYDGSFTYNIPLLTVPGPNGGYPINLAYHANPGMEEEAGWVGLGWSLNVGAINRQLQGIPDDFDGDQVSYEYHMKENWGFTAGTSFGGQAHSEMVGIPTSAGPTSTAFNTQLYFNNYKGLGYRASANFVPAKIASKTSSFFEGFVGLGLSFDSQNGIGIAPNISMGGAFKGGLGVSYNNRTGMNAVSFNMSYDLNKHLVNGLTKMRKNQALKSDKKWSALYDAVYSLEKVQGPNASASLSYHFGGQVPNAQLPILNQQWSFDVRLVGAAGSFRNAAPPVAGITTPAGFQAYPFLNIANPLSAPSNWYLDYFNSRLLNNSVDKGAVGYLYHQFSNNQVQDFTKQSLQFNKKMPNLGASKQTYDLFTFSGQGTGGFFRAYSNSIDLLSESQQTSNTVNVSLTAEVGIPDPNGTVVAPSPPPPVHIGGGYETAEGSTTSGGWQSGNASFNSLAASRFEAQQKVFRLHGENSPVLLDDEELDDWRGDAAVKNKLTHSGGYFGRTYEVTDQYVTDDGATPLTMDANLVEKRKRRDRRNTSVKYVNHTTAKDFGYSKNDKYINESGDEVNKFNVAEPHSSSHISEVVVTQTDGVKYIYGRPVYNSEQVEFSQSVSGTGYTPNNPYGNITEDVYGAAHQYNEEMKNKTTYPEYAYSWLLSGIVGTDYIDDDGTPGISQGDKGYWVKFNYRRKHELYRWRVPYGGANIIERRNGNDQDNIGTFTYGTKEIFYLDKVETSTHVAIFETGCRRDGIGAESEFAATTAVGDQKQQYLKKITLYTRPDYEANISDLSNAVPVMTVHFKYDYQLCKDVPNYIDDGCDTDEIYDSETNPDGHIIDDAGTSDDNTGKLTLREVYFTYEKSSKAALSPYKFYYSPADAIASGAHNPDYNINRLDRWGSFKNNGAAGYGSVYEFGRFPYTEQRADVDGILEDTDMQEAKWSLHRVQLPTGGTVKINYEPHDYAWEESERPMHMYDIIGVGNEVDETSQALQDNVDGSAADAWQQLDGSDDPVDITSSLTSSPDRFNSTSTEVLADLDEERDGGFRLFFKLDKPYSSSLTLSQRNNEIRTQYIKELKKIWFKNKTLMSGTDNLGASKGQFEYVEGYATIDFDKITDESCFGMCREIGLSSGAPFTIGYITLKKVSMRENNEGIVKGNEMQKLALQVLKLERDDVGYTPAFAGPASGSGTLGSALGFLSSTVGFADEIFSMILSYNVNKKIKKHCKYIALNGNSKIKLYDEDQHKYGGGYRVSEIRLDDNWKNDETASASIESGEYGQRFVYTMNSKLGGMSSGVCYEPANGREESALRKPAEYEQSTFLSYHSMMFVEKPIMEAYYPGANIGYRKVTTYSLSREIAAEKIASTSSTAGGVNYTASAPVSVMEFYTPREFPVQVDETNIDVESPFIIPISIPGIYSYLEAKKAASQGYSITLNDMAGKPKRSSQYRWLPPTDPGDPVDIGELGSVIATTEYMYKTAGTYNEDGTNALDNTVQLALNDHEYMTGKMGVYYDMFVENHESVYEESGFGLQANVDLLAGLGIPLPSVFPSGTETEMSEKTVVTHKIVYRSGVLEKVVAKTDQSVVTTENLLYDLETGAPVLTRTNNLFDDPVYTLQQPAHWYYKNTGPMYQNDYLVLVDGAGATDDLSIDGDGWLPITLGGPGDSYRNIDNFSEGDQVIVTYSGSGTKVLGTVAAIHLPTSSVNLMKANGDPLAAGSVSNVTMLQSGRRNMLGLNVGAVSALACSVSDFTSPVGSPTSYTLDKILDASAITLSDDWQMDCCNPILETEGNLFNPFVTGSRNMWRVKSSYGYNVERVYNNNSRTDGVFTDFDPFNWSNPDGDPNWVKAGRVARYSPHGFEAETEDALGNYSSARYGYGNILPVAIASNTRYANMDFEGFEYFNEGNCLESKELFTGDYTGFLSAGNAHTGKYGMAVEATPFAFNVDVENTHACGDVSHHYTPEGNPGEVEYHYDSECDCFGKSYVLKDGKYIFSAWAKETGWTNKPTSFTAPQIVVTFYEGVAVHSTLPAFTLNNTDKIVEGWQRFFFEIEVPNDPDITSMKIELKNNNNATRDVFYDDLRLHPKASNMVSYVYDALNYKLRAELDANNFATFYSYDKEGNLINTKKETVRGVKTITTGRKELQKRGM